MEAKQSLTKMADNVQSWQARSGCSTCLCCNLLSRVGAPNYNVTALQVMHGAADAKDSLSKLANNVSTWWANLDPVPKPQPISPGREAHSNTDTKVMTNDRILLCIDNSSTIRGYS